MNSLRAIARRLAVPVAALAGFAAGNAGAADIFNGREVYAQHCETCHGADGRPMEPGTPDFSRGEGLFAMDSDLFRQVRNGEGAMPAYRGLLSDDEIRDVVAYLRTLQQ